MMYLGIVFFSLSINLLIIYLSKKYNIMIDCEQSGKPQRFHVSATPRVGGIGIMLASFFMLNEPMGMWIILSSLPIFLIGLFEDFSGMVSPKIRLVFMAIGAVIATFTLNVLITEISFVKLPYIISFLFTVFALVGVTNSINIIDGLHGLASGTAIIAFFALSSVAFSLGDQELGVLILVSMFSVAGFFVCVYPWGKIFLGDGGAYYLGFLLAVFSTLLVNRNPDVSVWYPFAVLIFPVWEVVFSIFRRKFVRKQDALSPDRLHLHSLLYKRAKYANFVASGILLLIYIGYQTVIINFYNDTPMLLLFIIGFISIYYIFYLRLIRFEFKVIKAGL